MTLTEFHLFSKFPPELRQMIWSATIEDAGDLVSFVPQKNREVYRRENPVISMVNRESRYIFLLSYALVAIQSTDSYSNPSSNRTDHGYFNPDTDILVLGRQPNTYPNASEYMKVDDIESSIRDRIRQVRLCNEESIALSHYHVHCEAAWRHTPGRPAFGRARRLFGGNLCFPNLDTIWTVNYSTKTKIPASTPLVEILKREQPDSVVNDPRFGDPCGLEICYVIPTGNAYIRPMLLDDVEDGLRTLRLDSEAAYISLSCVRLVRDEQPDWVADG